MAKNKNSCITYFSVTGQFDPEAAAARLGLAPVRFWRATELRPDGKPYGFDRLVLCRCEDYHVYTEEQMEKTLAPLFDKVAVLKALKAAHGVDFCLQVVPTVTKKERTPALAPSLKVIQFCAETGTELDIDLYVV